VDLGIDPVYDSPLEFLQAGAMSALICVDEPERVKAVKAALADLNFHGSLASSVKEALSKLRYNQYDLVIVDEEFCGETAENNTILRYLQPMPMATRRSIFLALISRKHRTLDNLVSFAMSVNAVINVSDVPKVKMIMERAIAEHRRFYKVFLDMFQAAGGV
jgi:DNA-binding NtrC family response regulator